MKDVNARGKRSLARKILGIFRFNKDFLPSSDNQEDESVRVNIAANYDSWKSVGTALLEAERKKAEVLMEKQRRSFLC